MNDELRKLTPTQCLELDLLESAIRDNLSDRPDPLGLTLDVAVALSEPGIAGKGERHVQHLAAVARYLVAERITTEHFAGFMLELPLCSNVAWILRGRDDHLAESESTGYAVLVAAGFGPPSAQAV